MSDDLNTCQRALSLLAALTDGDLTAVAHQTAERLRRARSNSVILAYALALDMIEEERGLRLYPVPPETAAMSDGQLIAALGA